MKYNEMNLTVFIFLTVSSVQSHVNNSENLWLITKYEFLLSFHAKSLGSHDVS